MIYIYLVDHMHETICTIHTFKNSTPFSKIFRENTHLKHSGSLFQFMEAGARGPTGQHVAVLVGKD